MSLRGTRSLGRQQQRSGPGNFSSMSMGSYTFQRASSGSGAKAPITAVTVNSHLLTPLNVDVDPTIQVVRNQEKEQIKTLNNRFASFIDKVRFLEQQNKMLETKWQLMQNQTSASSNLEPMLKAYIGNLEKQLMSINNEKQRLDMENAVMHKNVDDYKSRYEIEINKRNDAENEFVMLKKDVDSSYLSQADLDDRLSGIQDEFNFLKAFYDMELKELQENLKSVSVVVQMDNSRDLNMEQIIAGAKAQYEDIASRSRTEAENLYMKKVDQITSEADQYATEMRNNKEEIAGLKWTISRLQNEIHSANAQLTNLETQLTEAERRGDGAVQDAKVRIRDLELAMQRAKQDMAHQLREYQELMNIKLALDIEISTYKKLLEGEEERLGQGSIVNIHELPGQKAPKVNTHRRQRSNPLVIKTVETQNRFYETQNSVIDD